MTHLLHLTTHLLSFATPTGRTLFEGLDSSLAYGERVAVVGRNGSGKSTLLQLLMGHILPHRGTVTCEGSRWLVPQLNPSAELSSPGVARRAALEAAFRRRPAFLLLDEPSLDLDEVNASWLESALERFEGACLVVSHDRRVLRHFSEFFIVAEAGCQHHSGSFDSLLRRLAEEHERQELRYLRELNSHVEQEAHFVRLAQRRERKKNVGRIRELKRCSSRAKLNLKRSSAQESQARRSEQQRQRLNGAREWLAQLRGSLAAELPLTATMPELPPAPRHPIIDARELVLQLDGSGRLTSNATETTLRVSRERWAVTGPNGCGKSTLLETLVGNLPPTHGRVTSEPGKIGYIAQNAANWIRPESLLQELCYTREDLPRAADLVAAHRFPVALAHRPLASLSPGERLRAALLVLFARRPPLEVLVLDEPTNHLDLAGVQALERTLSAWVGGLVVVSHDHEFLRAIGIDHHLCLARR